MSRTKLFRHNLPNFIFEVTIIIVGILLSLMISNWVEGSKDSKKEKAYLQQIKADLEDDLARLKADLDIRGGQLNFVTTTLQTINTPEGKVSMEDFSGGIQQLMTTVTFVPNNVSFSSLENTGQLQLIENQEIVTGLLDLYTNSYASLELNNDDVTIYRNNFIVPYIIEHIDMNGAMYRRDPGNIDEVIADQTFTNHLLYNQISLFSTQGAYQRGIDQVESLLALVVRELE